MRTVLIPFICLLLGLASGYMITNVAGGTTEVTPAMIEEGIRKNPRMILDLIQQYPEEIFDMVLAGQDIKRSKARDAQIAEQLNNPVTVNYSEDRPIRGKKDAPITIVEVSDFQCPHCSSASKTVEDVLKAYPDDVNLVFLHMPLSSHEVAPLAAAYFEAASMQDEAKAWKLHDLFFANQKELYEKGTPWIRKQAEDLGLDMVRLQEDLIGDEVRKRMEADLEESKRIGLRGTPSFIVGGVLISGAVPENEFIEVVEKVKQNLATKKAAAAEKKTEPLPQQEQASDNATATQ